MGCTVCHFFNINCWHFNNIIMVFLNVFLKSLIRNEIGLKLKLKKQRNVQPRHPILTHTKSISKKSIRFEYHENSLYSLDVTCHLIKGELSVHPWTFTKLFYYSIRCNKPIARNRKVWEMDPMPSFTNLPHILAYVVHACC